MIKFFIERADGGVSIGDAADQENIEFMVDAWKTAHPGAYVSHGVVTGQIPADRDFRDGWKVSTGRVEHHLPKCKAIAHERRRARRAEEFKPLDIEATIPAKAADAEAKRQAIREKYDAMQAKIDAAQTVEEIKAIGPEVLK